MKISELNILVVEDDDFQRQMIIRLLRLLGVISIYDSSDGKQALEFIRGANFGQVHVALCDLNMPEMDGLEFMRHLSHELHDVAIIIISSMDNKLLASAGTMARMYGIKLLGMVEKPVSKAHLEEMLSKHEYTKNIQKKIAGAAHFTLEEILHGISAKQFEPFYQPKLDMKNDCVIGAEALARWNHPEHGVITPYAFIPQLEKSGNIDDLTFLMLEKSASACHSLHERGHKINISVNLSLVSLDDVLLADRITQTVKNAGIDPGYITLEITESAAMTDVAHALENLTRLCMNGFKLSIDDYGTGYSSMQQLTRIPFAELKIDQSFVKDVSDNNALRIVVESSIDMAHKLRVKSVAEGIETQRDWDTLKSMGCDTAQGYFIAKPMNLSSFVEFCEKDIFVPPGLNKRP